MAVTVVQFNDGVQSGSKTIVEPTRGETNAELLAWKLTRHLEGGWSLIWQTAVAFRVGKDYTNSTKDPGMALRVEREFRLEL